MHVVTTSIKHIYRVSDKHISRVSKTTKPIKNIKNIVIYCVLYKMSSNISNFLKKQFPN